MVFFKKYMKLFIFICVSSEIRLRFYSHRIQEKIILYIPSPLHIFVATFFYAPINKIEFELHI